MTATCIVVALSNLLLLKLFQFLLLRAATLRFAVPFQMENSILSVNKQAFEVDNTSKEITDFI